MIVKAAKCNTTFFGNFLRLDKDILVIEDDDQNGLQAAKAEIEAGRLIEVKEEELEGFSETLDVSEMNVEQLKSVAEQLGIEGFSKMKKVDLISAIERCKEEGEE
ncbi:hypothetical protein PVP_XSN000010 [Vibrio phage PVP-XSN]|uniref:Rho termination factor-like N-terminal domain-containing protein n=1 Tax=Vibrio phage PVP-XSN TaxID=3056214 RepID=A0AAX3Y3N5_9CAUD|nr:hypothetical protein PVP_XSN000041 [Vibrio phage PVP-XSN]